MSSPRRVPARLRHCGVVWQPAGPDRVPYTLGQAAQAVGRSKATLQEAIKKGRVSAIKDEFGRYRIEPAELHRVYPPAGFPNARPDAAEPLVSANPPEEIVRLQERVAGLERLCRQVEGERDSLREQNLRLTALLPKPDPEPARRGFWRSLTPWGRRRP